MLNFDIKRSSRRCAISDRPFESGEEYFSALIDVNGERIRQDFAIESWSQPPENCIGFWKSKMPSLDKGRVYWAPHDVLLSYFQHLVDDPDSADIAYVMAVLLVRKRSLQMIETDDSTEPPTLVVHHRKTKTDYRIPAIEIPSHRIKEIQNELAEHLFTDHAPETLNNPEDE